MYVGLHIHAGPAEPRPVPCPHNLRRSHDVRARLCWADVHQPGGFYWAELDWFAARCAEDGVQWCYVFGGTPAAFRTSDEPDGYGVPGRASVPTEAGFAEFRRFAEAFRARYPATVCPLVECLNEPTRDAGFNGTPADQARLYRTLRQVFTDRIVATPSFYTLADMVAFLSELTPLSAPMCRR